MPRSIYWSVVPVFDEPHCIWSFKPDAENLEFLKSLDPEFFFYLADTHSKNVESEKNRQAAVALRFAYLHGLETLFTLLAGTVQAPNLIYAWVQLCKTQQLHDVVEAIHTKSQNLLHLFPLREISWRGLSEAINRADPLKSRVETFAQAWELLAYDFMRDASRAELNSLKHGFRVQFGGFDMSWKGQGENAVETKCQGSKYGTQFFQLEKIDSKNFTVGRVGINWTPETLMNSLGVIGASITNIVAFLRQYNEEKDLENVRVFVPEQENIAETIMKQKLGVYTLTFSNNLTKEHIETISRDDMLKLIQGRMERIEEWRKALPSHPSAPPPVT